MQLFLSGKITGVTEAKEEGDNSSTTKSQKEEDSAGDDSMPMRKRKLRNKTEQQTVQVTAAAPPVRVNQPLEKPPNPYETYLNMRRQVSTESH